MRNVGSRYIISADVFYNKAKSLLPSERKMVEDAWDDGFTTGCVVGGNDYTNQTDDDTGSQYFDNRFGK